jgi:hypothetical protein
MTCGYSGPQIAWRTDISKQHLLGTEMESLTSAPNMIPRGIEYIFATTILDSAHFPMTSVREHTVIIPAGDEDPNRDPERVNLRDRIFRTGSLLYLLS